MAKKKAKPKKERKAKPKKERKAKPESLTVRKAVFLAAFAVCGNIGKAARETGTSRETHYDWKRSDPDYAARFRLATAEAIDRLEAEARRRAEMGVPRLKFFEGVVIMVPDPSGAMVPDPHGQMVLNAETNKFELPLMPRMVPYVEHQYSDTLLTLLLKANRPKKYRENAMVEHKGDLGLKVTGEAGVAPTRDEALKIYLELARQLPAKAK